MALQENGFSYRRVRRGISHGFSSGENKAQTDAQKERLKTAKLQIAHEVLTGITQGTLSEIASNPVDFVQSHTPFHSTIGTDNHPNGAEFDPKGDAVRFVLKAIQFRWNTTWSATADKMEIETIDAAKRLRIRGTDFNEVATQVHNHFGVPAPKKYRR